MSATKISGKLAISGCTLDNRWKQEQIPLDEICKSESPMTPKLRVSNLPVGTNAIIMEYNDNSLFLMDNGGHGKIGYAVPDGETSIDIPSIEAKTSEVADGDFWIVKEYMPPCSGGTGHEYSVTIKRASFLFALRCKDNPPL